MNDKIKFTYHYREGRPAFLFRSSSRGLEFLTCVGWEWSRSYGSLERLKLDSVRVSKVKALALIKKLATYVEEELRHFPEVL